MSYQVLARKWRPQVFTDVVGQKHVLTTLENALSMGRIHHAYLFSGTSGIGKTTIARIVAKGMNCTTSITSHPCCQCDQCNGITEGCCIDLIEIDAASRTKVEDIRDLLDNVQYTPYSGRFKIYLIDEVHMLSRHSFNVLLKTLEEPPPHVKFLLATTDPKKLPITILSRCLQFHLKVLTPDEIYSKLQDIVQTESIVTEDCAIRMLSYAADGNMRDALSLTDQAIVIGKGCITKDGVKCMLGSLEEEQPISLIEALVDADGMRVMELVKESASRGDDWGMLLTEILRLFHRIAMIQYLPSIISDDSKTLFHRLKKLAAALPPTDVQLYYQMILVGRKELPLAPNQRMGVEMTLLRILAFQPKEDATPPIKEISPKKISSLIQKSQGKDKVIITEEKSLQKSKVQTFVHTKNSLLYTEQDSIPDDEIVGKLLKNEKLVKNKSSQNVVMEIQKSSRNQNKEKNLSTIEDMDNKKNRVFLQDREFINYSRECQEKENFLEKIIQESRKRDTWSDEIYQLNLSELGKKLALNSWKENTLNNIYLHISSKNRHLNTPKACQELSQALHCSTVSSFNLIVIEDDHLHELTPLEWQYNIYQEKLKQARQSILTDTYVQTLCHYFNVRVDKDSIQLVL
ncbi:DNA polymerase III subunit gamma/tau [Candidatus Erwinia haradaeae]|uniref:DNA polymerase III subunit gamma/tau n=1 Tax=Candidatus Erwinia haradaeae TaxID=1922217 RepID=A0A451D1U4_9GAMM|nr:DNA polymerase III subunit gamma/tau [Candidatus Erwinia haradaeae]VFP79582.1 DNA polymerase III subunit tau [Candidatus Erwinia haradaeae]